MDSPLDKGVGGPGLSLLSLNFAWLGLSLTLAESNTRVSANFNCFLLMLHILLVAYASIARLGICRDYRDWRLCKFFVSCVNLSKKTTQLLTHFAS